MGDFVLGPIKIIDNGDGVYRSPVKDAKTPQDEVQDLQGTTVKPTGAEAQQALKQLGVTSLVGLRLAPASRYLEMLSQAKTAAAKGDTVLTQDYLHKARLAAAEAKLTFPESRATSILKTSLEKELTLMVDRAKTLADSGDVLALADNFMASREILSRLGVPFERAKDQGYPFHQELIDELELKAYANAFPLAWKQVEQYSQEGNVVRTQEAIGKARNYAARGQVGLTTEQETALTEFERKAYENSIEKLLVAADGYSAQGDVDNTRLYSQKARDAAGFAKTPLSKKQESRIRRMERTALRLAPDYFLPLAEAKADTGDVEATRSLIQRAKDCRAQVGLALTKADAARADAAEQKALRLSVDVLLAKASSAVDEVKKNGNISKVKAFLDQARENAALAGIKLSAAQEASAQSILKKAYQTAVDWRFAQARGSAFSGKVDDTIVPLTAGRELAKQGGVNFDENEAKTLIQTALTNGMELEFVTAEKFAKDGDADNTHLHLETARDDARRLGVKFDEKRATAILKQLPVP